MDSLGVQTLSFPVMKISNQKELEIAVKSSPEMENAVKSIIKSHYTINVAEAITSLTTINKLLQLAVCAGRASSCYLKIQETLSNYQDLVFNSVGTTHKFITT